MQQLLTPGKTMVTTTTSSSTVTIDSYLGGGGQGEVYSAKLGGQSVALKWYFPHTATDQQRKALQNLIQVGAPTRAFLWPIELASSSEVPGFGYVMPLREPRFRGMVDLVKRRVDPSFRNLSLACYNLADGFYHLHISGLCYRDISFGNVFFDPDNGEILIADNDNVVVNGSESGGVQGTPRFMAPEVVRNDGRPSAESDLFSLAVLLFYMLMIHHPLEGKRESAIHALDVAAMNRLYGEQPLFIFDPHDRSNEPDPAYHGNALAFWPLYPEFIRALFVRSFTDGLADATHGRVQESEWRRAMLRLHDSIVPCANCGAENFYDFEAIRAANGMPGECWSCQTPLAYPPRIRIGPKIVMLTLDAQLYPHHIDSTREFDLSAPVAAVTQHPTDPSKWGLKNLSESNWVATPDSGTPRDVGPGQSIQIAIGTRINFGTTEGEFRV